MQAITIAIGKSGILFFAKQFLSNKIVTLLKTLQAPSRNITVPSFKYSEAPLSTTTVSNYSLELSQGQILNFAPDFADQVIQGLNNGMTVFTLNFNAGPFQAAYNWAETYHWDTVGVTGGPRPVPYHQSGDSNFSDNYSPEFSGMLVTVAVQFAFDTPSGSWQISVQNTNGQSTALDTGLPSGSVLRFQSGGCSGYHFDQTTAQAIEDVNFGPPINDLISGILKTIPGSGNLGNGIVYDFSLGDGGILFPNNDGIQMGVKGGASYNGQAYPATPPPPLAMPPAPADSDSHHLNLYVSGFEVDALNWAFFKAGELNLVVNKQDLAHPDELTVKLYADEGEITALKPYEPWDMQAQVVLNAAPTTAFQTVYEFNKTVMDTLQNLYPDLRQQLSDLQGNNYLDLNSLENELNGLAIPPAFYATIEATSRRTGMVVSHDLNLILVIQDKNLAPADYPNIVFHVTRTDILTDLCLGNGPNQAQTLQFQFSNYTYDGRFVSTTVPGMGGDHFPCLWGEVCEPFYDQHLQSMGKNGVPLPIMQGLQFEFTNAELDIQDGYVSILANVVYQNS